MSEPTTFDALRARGVSLRKVAPATINTAGAVTLTAAQLINGLILRDPNGAGRTDTTPTAEQLFEAIGGDSIKDVENAAFEFTIRNTANSNETITLAGGTGVTISGTATIGQNNSKTFLAVFTDADTVVIYSLGTVVH